MKRKDATFFKITTVLLIDINYSEFSCVMGMKRDLFGLSIEPIPMEINDLQSGSCHPC